MKLLVVGRPANIVNLKSESTSGATDNFYTASSKVEMVEIINKYEVDSVVVGAGLEASDHLEIVSYLLMNKTEVDVHLNSRNTGPEGLKLFVAKVLDMY